MQWRFAGGREPEEEAQPSAEGGAGSVAAKSMAMQFPMEMRKM